MKTHHNEGMTGLPTQMWQSDSSIYMVYASGYLPLYQDVTVWYQHLWGYDSSYLPPVPRCDCIMAGPIEYDSGYLPFYQDVTVWYQHLWFHDSSYLPIVLRCDFIMAVPIEYDNGYLPLYQDVTVLLHLLRSCLWIIGQLECSSPSLYKQMTLRQSCVGANINNVRSLIGTSSKR